MDPTTTPPPLLAVHNLCISVGNGQQEEQVVEQLSFTLRKGEVLGLVGESGSGKSLTALSILRLLPREAYVSRGEIIWHSPSQGRQNLMLLTQAQLRKVRGREIGVIFQDPMSSLDPTMPCGQQIAATLLAHQLCGKHSARQQALDLLHKVKFEHPRRAYEAYPHQLSGGQCQRVMIAMALACNPALLIADEPTTSLDTLVQANILELFREMGETTDMAMLFVSHDLGVVSQVADQVLVMQKGHALENGPVQHIFQQPQHPYTKSLIGCHPPLHLTLSRLPTLSDFDPGEVQEDVSVGTVLRKLTIPAEEKVSQQWHLQALQPDLVVDNLHVSYAPRRFKWFWEEKEAPLRAVDGVSFAVRPGETLGIVGGSGSGKSTLAKALLGLVKPSGGHIWLQGKPLPLLRYSLQTTAPHPVQAVFQDPYPALNPSLTLGEMLMEPMLAHHLAESREEARAKAYALLAAVHLPAAFFHKYPYACSGGQRQRACIARALAMEPRYLICDEAVSALDVSTQAQILNLLNELKENWSLTLLFITHDMAVARFMADTLAVMHQGKIAEYGNARDVFNQPVHPYTQTLLGAIPKVQFELPTVPPVADFSPRKKKNPGPLWQDI
jgi:peptide/nickel transport system ATP-binding protein